VKGPAPRSLSRLRSCAAVVGMGPWPFRRRLMAVQRGTCFIDSMATVTATPTRAILAHPARCKTKHAMARAGARNSGTVRQPPGSVCTGVFAPRLQCDGCEGVSTVPVERQAIPVQAPGRCMPCSCAVVEAFSYRRLLLLRSSHHGSCSCSSPPLSCPALPCCDEHDARCTQRRPSIKRALRLGGGPSAPTVIATALMVDDTRSAR
jgi:hypothetical protein